MSYGKISWSLEAARFGFKPSDRSEFDTHLGSSAAEMPVKFQSDTISWLRDFTRFGGKTSYSLVNRCPVHTVGVSD